MIEGLIGLGIVALATRVKASRGRYDWHKRAPKLISERRRMPASCFLGPNRTFPICPRGTRGRQVVDCEGVRAAYSRARQYHHRAIADKALRKAKRSRCRWAMD